MTSRLDTARGEGPCCRDGKRYRKGEIVETTPTATPRSLTDRMLGAAQLDASTFEEVEGDESATSQAALVVGMVAVASAVGGVGGGARGVVAGLLSAFLGWLVWSGITFLVGDRLLGGKATWGELLRTLGFAQAPGVLFVLGVVPVLGVFVRLAVSVWILVAGIVAIRQALDFTTGKAIATAVIGWLGYAVLAALLPGL